MIKRWVSSFLCAAAVTFGVSAVVATPVASAAPCADVQVIFARGTVETAPPLGVTGIAFTEALRAQLRGKSLATYAVNYPASADFGNRVAFAETVAQGIGDTQAHIKSIAAACPRTRIVLGGYSQGAAVVGLAIGPRLALPAQYAKYADRVPGPLPTDLADHVAAVVYFAAPSSRFLKDAGAPPLAETPGYAAKTIRYCIPGDNICNGAPLAQPTALHVLYSVNGNAIDAAQRVAARV